MLLFCFSFLLPPFISPFLLLITMLSQAFSSFCASVWFTQTQNLFLIVLPCWIKVNPTLQFFLSSYYIQPFSFLPSISFICLFFHTSPWCNITPFLRLANIRPLLHTQHPTSILSWFHWICLEIKAHVHISIHRYIHIHSAETALEAPLQALIRASLIPADLYITSPQWWNCIFLLCSLKLIEFLCVSSISFLLCLSLSHTDTSIN